MSFFKQPAWRNEAYLSWVRVQTCVCCGAYGKQHAHHNIANRFGTSKAPDAWTLPLCATCHTLLHSDWPAWEEANNTQDRHCLILLNLALVDGVLEINKRKILEAA